ncbi:MAG TPA: LysM domain-containing protein, partial [Armatimonadetes bacterium]|nr:LysM domain-containing protein [Armatimonadota bacterium]
MVARPDVKKAKVSTQGITHKVSPQISPLAVRPAIAQSRGRLPKERPVVSSVVAGTQLKGVSLQRSGSAVQMLQTTVPLLATPTVIEHPIVQFTYKPSATTSFAAVARKATPSLPIDAITPYIVAPSGIQLPVARHREALGTEPVIVSKMARFVTHSVDVKHAPPLQIAVIKTIPKSATMVLPMRQRVALPSVAHASQMRVRKVRAGGVTTPAIPLVKQAQFNARIASLDAMRPEVHVYAKHMAKAKVVSRYTSTTHVEVRVMPRTATPRIARRMPAPHKLRRVIVRRAKQFVYTVKAGETLHSLARKFGVSPQVLMRANKLREPRHLREGQKLIIPRTPIMVKYA